MNNDYKIYRLIFPNNKIYIGATSQPIEKRWCRGYGYYNQKQIYTDIQKYGWDKITKIILYDNLTKEDAFYIEQFLIELEDATNPSKGYNILVGHKFGTFYDKLTEKQRVRTDVKLKSVIESLPNVFNKKQFTTAIVKKYQRNKTVLECKLMIEDHYEKYYIDNNILMLVRVSKSTREKYDIPNKYKTNSMVYIKLNNNIEKHHDIIYNMVLL